MPLQCRPEVTRKVPWALHEAPPLAPNHTDGRVWDIHGPLKRDSRAQGAGGEKESVDLGENVEACRHKRLHALRSHAQPGPHPMLSTPDCGKPESGLSAPKEKSTNHYLSVSLGLLVRVRFMGLRLPNFQRAKTFLYQLGSGLGL